MNHWRRVYLGNALPNTIPEFLPGLNAHVPEERARHLAEQRLDNVEPGAVSRGAHVLELINGS